MDVIIVGAGPTGLTLGAALARRRHRVVAVDRDPGPAPDGSWQRRGVMQFDQAHGFRPQVRDLLLAEWPEAWRSVARPRRRPVELPAPGTSSPAIGVRSRRSTYERALRRAAADVDGLTVADGRVEGIVGGGGAGRRGGRRRLDTSGRPRRRRQRAAVPVGTTAGDRRRHRHGVRVTDVPAEGGSAAGPAGQPVRVERHVRRATTATSSPTSTATSRWCSSGPRPTPSSAVLRHLDAFEAACRAIPALADWTDPQVTTPTSGVIVGGGLLNLYRPQLGRPGLVAVGDAVATTAPTAGRGLAMASMQIGALLELLDAGADPATIAGAVRHVVRHVDAPVGRGPPGLRRRSGPPMAGTRHRPRPAADLGGDRRGRPGRPPHRVRR